MKKLDWINVHSTWPGFSLALGFHDNQERFEITLPLDDADARRLHKVLGEAIARRDAPE